MANILNYTCLIIVLVSIASAAELGLECQFLSPGAECEQRMWCAATAGHPLPTCQYFCAQSHIGNIYQNSESNRPYDTNFANNFKCPFNSCKRSCACMALLYVIVQTLSSQCSTNGYCMVDAETGILECSCDGELGGPLCNTCTDDTDCMYANACSNGTCQLVSCGKNYECGNGRTCINRICIPDICNEDSQCMVPNVCSNHVCQVVYCLGNTQCENNRFCINEICGQGNCNEDSQCMLPNVCNNQVCQVVYCLGNTQCENNRVCINDICMPVQSKTDTIYPPPEHPPPESPTLEPAQGVKDVGWHPGVLRLVEVLKSVERVEEDLKTMKNEIRKIQKEF